MKIYLSDLHTVMWNNTKELVDAIKKYAVFVESEKNELYIAGDFLTSPRNRESYDYEVVKLLDIVDSLVVSYGIDDVYIILGNHEFFVEPTDFEDIPVAQRGFHNNHVIQSIYSNIDDLYMGYMGGAEFHVGYHLDSGNDNHCIVGSQLHSPMMSVQQAENNAQEVWENDGYMRMLHLSSTTYTAKVAQHSIDKFVNNYHVYKKTIAAIPELEKLFAEYEKIIDIVTHEDTKKDIEILFGILMFFDDYFHIIKTLLERSASAQKATIMTHFPFDNGQIEHVLDDAKITRKRISPFSKTDYMHTYFNVDASWLDLLLYIVIHYTNIMQVTIIAGHTHENWSTTGLYTRNDDKSVMCTIFNPCIRGND